MRRGAAFFRPAWLSHRAGQRMTSPSIYTYPLAAPLITAHSSPNKAENVLEEVLREAIDNTPHRTISPEGADFYFVPVPFHWAGRGRKAVASVLTHIRMAWPYFNRSLESKHPNHLLVFTGDLGLDTPPQRHFAEPLLPPEVDTASRSRHFVALTLTGNPETGFQVGKDVVLPPTRELRGGPMRACCDEISVISVHTHGQRSKRKCKPIPRTLSDSPWHLGPPAAKNTSSRYLLFWAGQASGGGMGRHGGSGPATRKWLARSVAGMSTDMLVTDTNNREHLTRNVRVLPKTDLYAHDPKKGRYGWVHPSAAARASFCAAPYGRGNGWEGRSAAAVRKGCVPVRLQPAHALMALEPLVPWERFSVVWRADEARMRADPNGEARQLRAALAVVTPAALGRMKCEMACAAVHMTWEASPALNPPASCAGAAQGASRRKTGVVATLMTLLDNRRRPPEHRVVPRPCPCERVSDEWHFFAPDLLRNETERAEAAHRAWLSLG